MNVSRAKSFLNLTDLEEDEAKELVSNKRDLVNYAQDELEDDLETGQRMMEIFKNNIWTESDLDFFEAFDATPIEFSVARPLINKLIYRQRNRQFQYRYSPQDIHSFRRYKSEKEQFIQDNIHEFDYSKEDAGRFYDNYADDEYAKTISGMTSKYRSNSDGKWKESECFEGGLITGADFLKAEKDIDGKPKINRRSLQKMFWDPNATEYDLSDSEYIGEVEEWYKQDLIAQFPEAKEDIERHFERYSNLKENNKLKVDKKWKDWYDFDDQEGPKVKISEFWYLDTEKRFLVYDTETGDERLVEHDYTEDQVYDELMLKLFNDIVEKAESEGAGEQIAEDENLKNKVQGMAEKRFEVTETYKPVWMQCVFSFNSLLVSQRSHFPHKEHPFYPFFAQHNDGNFNSFIEDIEEIIVALNKALAFRELMMAHASKGMLIVDEKTLQDSGYSVNEVADEYTRIGGLLALKLKLNKGVSDVIDQISTVGDGMPAINKLISDYDQRLYNISGVNLAQLGVTQGETPTSRYKEQLAQGEENNGVIFDNFIRSLEGFYGDKVVPLVAERIKENPEEVARMIGRQRADFHKLDFNKEFDLFVDAVFNGEYTFSLIPEDDDQQKGAERQSQYWELAMNGQMPIEIPIKYSDDPNRYDILRDMKKWKHEQKLEQIQNNIDLKRVEQMLLQNESLDSETADKMIKKMRAEKMKEAQEQSAQNQPKPKNMQKIKQNANQTKKQKNIDRSTNPQ